MSWRSSKSMTYLFNANESRPTRPPCRLLARWYPSIIVCFIHEEDNQDQTERRHKSIERESPLPLLSADDEGCKQGSEVRGQNDERCPDIDLSGMFVEEEHVFNPHQAALSLH